ncbi:hypothetical protein [Streptomyces achromogenes]|uniref:hypothetical protein n=1 Tax=Streptomyces achromogenes TaxID=67255 RepID=UPI0036CE42C4
MPLQRAGAQKTTLIHQHSDEDRQRAVTAALDDMVRAERAKHHTYGADVVRGPPSGQDNKQPPGL